MYLADRPRATPATPGERPGRRRKGQIAGTVWALGAVSLLTDISSESMSAVLPVYLTAVLGLSPLAYGFIDGIYQGVSSLVRILGGYAADRVDRPKWVAAFGYGLSAVTKALLVVFHGFGALTAVITLDRLGKGVRTGPRDALIAAATPSTQLGRAFGVHRAMDTVGAVIGPLLAFTILWLVPGGYAPVFLASFAAAALGVIVLVLLVPDLRPRAAAAAAGNREVTPPVRPSLSRMRRHGMGRLMVAAGLLSVLAISDGFLYLALQRRDNLAAMWFPLLFVGTNIAYVLLAVPFGRLADRIGRQRVLVGGHLFLVAAYLAVAGPASGPAITVLCLVFLGAFYAMTDGVLAALTASIVPVELRAVGISTTQTVVALGRFASSFVFGALWTTIGRTPAVLIFAGALLLMVPVAGWLLAGLTRPNRHEPSQERSES